MATRPTYPMPLSRGRTGRRVRRRHWFVDSDGGFESGESSWADALSRIVATGEALVVDLPRTGDAEETERLHNNVTTAIHKSANRRGLRLTQRWDGEYLVLTIRR